MYFIFSHAIQKKILAKKEDGEGLKKKEKKDKKKRKEKENRREKEIGIGLQNFFIILSCFFFLIFVILFLSAKKRERSDIYDGQSDTDPSTKGELNLCLLNFFKNRCLFLD